MKLLVLRAMCCAVLAVPAIAAAIEPATLIKLASSVLMVEVIRAQGGYSLGSGVVVGAGRVATNCHVTRDAREIAVLQSGVRLPAEAQHVDADHDVCVLQVPGIEGDRAVAFGQSATLVLGQPLTAIGHTAGALQHSPGEVVALHRMDGSRIIRASNYFNSGASGGGLFDADSRLVGLLTFRLRGGVAHYFAVPAEWLQRDLRDADAQSRPVAPIAPGALAFWQRPTAAQPFFLRAAVVENNADWRALQPLAVDWVQHEPSDPEPWYLLGLALERQQRPDEARHPLQCALALAPGYAPARTELDRLPAATGPAVSIARAETSSCHF